MIRFKVINVKKNMQFAIIGIILLMFAAFIAGAWRSTKSIPVFGGGMSRSINEGINLVQRLNEGVFMKMICWSLPVIDAASDEEFSPVNLVSLARNAFKMLTNADIDNPKSYFSLQVPIMSLAASEMVSTPGVEVPEKDPAVVENEHVPEQNPPAAPEPEMSAEVEKIAPVKGKPLVLIYHTHTTESYTPSKAYNYKPRDNAYHTDDLNFSVVRVGDVMADELNKMGIPALHNKTIHDVPTYMTSYTNSLKTCEQILKANPSIKILIDLHRDAPVADPQKSRELTTVKIDGKTYSRIMLVIGSDKTFPHPHWKENYQFGVLVDNKLEELYPGISRGIDLRKERFNQHLSNKAILVEIGSHGNTMEESIASAKAFARALSEVIKNLTL
ncbi:MAG: stage II sporulation protein P [Tepidanaerobacteraceae bacterium]|nr:stage II sporulation protein P [Tepidanaerobacteraceae bacterium]